MSSVGLHYLVESKVLHIQLCPIGALCLVNDELIGPVDPDELVLTRRIGGTSGSVYRFFLSRPD